MTTTWNIHPNLTAWASGQMIGVGNRRSSGGNAYQAIQGGTTSTGNAPTGTASFIPTADGLIWKWLSAIDYTSLQAWADFVMTTYTNQPTNWIVYIWNNGSITTTLGNAYMNLYGITAGSFTTLITAAPGESFVDKGNSIPLAFSTTSGVNFDTPATGTEPSTQYFYVAIDNVSFSRLMFRDSNPSNDNPNGTTLFVIGGNGSTMSQCILDGCLQWYTDHNNCGFVNCLIVNRCTTPVFPEWPVKWDVSCTGAFFMESTCVGLGGGAGNVSGDPGGILVMLNSTPRTAVAINSIIIGGNTTQTPNPLFAQNTSNGWVANNCATDVSNFGSNAVSSAGVFNLVSSNEFVNPSTDFRLKSTSRCLDAGITETTHDTTSVDIFGTSRPQSSAWDIGAYEYGLFNVLLRAGTATPTAARKSSNKHLSFPNNIGGANPFSSIFSIDFGEYLYGPAQVVNTTQTKQSIPHKAVSVGSTQATHSDGSRGKSPSASLGQSAAFSKIHHAVSVVAAKAIEGFQILWFVGKSTAVTEPQSASAIKAASTIVSGVAGPQASSLTKAPGKVGAVIALQASSMTRQIAVLRGVISVHVVLVVRGVAKALFGSTSNVAAATAAATLLHHEPLSVPSAETAGIVAGHVAPRSFSISIQESVKSFQGRSFNILPSVTSGYVLSLARQMVVLRGSAVSQAINAGRGISSVFSAAAAMAEIVIKGPGKVASIIGAAAQSLSRTPGKVPSAILASSAIAIKDVMHLIGGVSTQSAGSASTRQMSRAYAAGSPQSLIVARQSGHGAGASSGAAQAVSRQTARLMGAVEVQTVSLVGTLGRTTPKTLDANTSEIVAILKTPSKLLLAIDANVASAIEHRGHSVLIIGSESFSVARQISIVRPSAGANAAAVAKGQFRTLATQTINLATSLASRAKNLGVLQAAAQAAIAWYRFYIPPATGPAVLIPPAGGPPEPFAFGPMDPSDTAMFIFDWSKRAIPGDTIASVTVTSVPSGMNFVGPVFVSGLEIEVTCGPFNPPQLPAVYGLRCSVTFVSGRRSTFTVPVPVRVL